MEKVCVVGFGAIGALYAYALEKSGKVEVTAICRSNYHTIQENGLQIESDRFGVHASWRPHRVVHSVEQAAGEQYSYIVCASKSLPDVHPTSEILAPLLDGLVSSPETAIVLLQNGIGIEDDIYDALSRRRLNNAVISGCAWVDATAVDKGRKVTQHGRERLVVGFHRPPCSLAFSEAAAKAALDHFSELLVAAGGNVEVSEIDVARWRKVLWNASFSTICTLTQARVGEVLAVPQSRAALQEIMEEVLAVARATLPNDNLFNSVLHSTVAQDIVHNENPESVFKPSMLVDYEAGRPIEVEAIVGGILRRAQEKGIDTPRLAFIYASLKVIQRKLIEGRPN